jgi:hypothetical protein
MKIIKDVIAIKILDGEVYYNTIEGVLFKNYNIFKKDVDGFSFWLRQGVFYYYNKEGISHILNTHNGKEYRGDIAFSMETLHNNNLICYFANQVVSGEWKYKIGLFDISSMSIVKYSDLSTIDFFYRNENYYLVRKNKEGMIYKIDNDFQISWQFSVKEFPAYLNGFYQEQKADIKQIIGVYNNILWVHVGGFRLAGIDIGTGKMIHYVEDVLKGENRNNFINQQKGIILTLSYDYYAEFDLQTLQFRTQTTVKNEADIKIRASSFYEGDKYLYFCGYHNNKFDKPAAFGIFDTEKAEIIWYDTTKDNSGYFYNPPQANNKLLAILDDKHNLLVYERE